MSISRASTAPWWYGCRTTPDSNGGDQPKPGWMLCWKPSDPDESANETKLYLLALGQLRPAVLQRHRPTVNPVPPLPRPRNKLRRFKIEFLLMLNTL